MDSKRSHVKPAAKQDPNSGQSDERGADTRLRLLEAGLDLFGRQGFDGTSTRELAERAGVNLGAIPYHFGGKEALYVAVAEHIAAQMRAEFAAPLAEIHAALSRGLSPSEARRFLHGIVDRFVDVVVGDSGGERWAPYMIREQMFPTQAFERIYESFISPMHGLACRLLATARGGALPDDPLRVFTFIGQMLVFRAARASVFRKMDWDAMSADRLAEIKTVLHANIESVISGVTPT